GDTFHSISYEIMSREPASPAAVNPLISPRLDQLCLKMQSHNPDERPQMAREILKELELIKEELI
ncbi:hypothetical protein IJT10_07895, partial [bacterium]|nr:hypothetical protein [bacterium]